MIHVEVTYALPEKQRLIGLDVPEGTTMLEAARLSGIDEQFADLELGKAPMGVFGKVVANPAGHILKAGERVEIYRPLTACLLYTSPSPRDRIRSRMPSSA